MSIKPKLKRNDKQQRNSQPHYQATDYGNAERFVALHGHNVRYCHPWKKWLIWDGKRWSLDETGAPIRLAKQTVRHMYDQAKEESDDAARTTLIKWALQSEKAERLTAMLKLAQSEPGVPIVIDDLDQDPWLLNVENGTLDLRTGELRDHDRADLLTKLAPVEYLPPCEAECPMWRKFLNDIFAGNEDITCYVQRLMGYALTGLDREHILPIFHGVGANGKSTFVSTLAGLLGSSYSTKAPRDLLTVNRDNSHPTGVAGLFGKRLVVASETDDSCRLSEALIKDLTGGEMVKARRMREDFWEFKPTHTMILSTNHKPTVRGTDHAIWRRLRLVPFNVVIPDAKQDKALPEKLRKEWPGILRWAVEGCNQWQAIGLAEPEEILGATKQYRGEEDVLGSFFNEWCAKGPGHVVRCLELYEAYKRWAEKSGLKRIMPQNRFARVMTERGFERESMNRATWYQGIDLLEDAAATITDHYN
jgi:putative DNA primase/helicase